MLTETFVARYEQVMELRCRPVSDHAGPVRACEQRANAQSRWAAARALRRVWKGAAKGRRGAYRVQSVAPYLEHLYTASLPANRCTVAKSTACEWVRLRQRVESPRLDPDSGSLGSSQGRIYIGYGTIAPLPTNQYCPYLTFGIIKQ